MLDAPLPWWYWELQDWATVFAEGGLFLLVLAPRQLRPALAVLVIFHVGVFFTMGIFFWFNLIAYAALLDWRGLLRRRPVARAASGVASLIGRLRGWQIALILAAFGTYGSVADRPLTAMLLWPLVAGDAERGEWLVGVAVCGPLALAVTIGLLHGPAGRLAALTTRRG